VELVNLFCIDSADSPPGYVKSISRKQLSRNHPSTNFRDEWRPSLRQTERHSSAAEQPEFEM
jgi:hypothetical protein